MSKNKIREQTETILEEIDEAVEEPVTVLPSVFARITGCDKLNVRSKPDIKSDVVTVIDKEAKFLINIVDGDWYPVKLKDGTSGFCLKKFVAVS